MYIILLYCCNNDVCGRGNPTLYMYKYILYGNIMYRDDRAVFRGNSYVCQRVYEQ